LRILITGITGFVGSHLAEYMLKLGHEVFGAARPRSSLDNLRLCKKSITILDCNVLDYISVYRIIKEINPDIIFHLAAQSFVPTSWNSPQDTFTTNVIGTLNVLESVKALRLNCIIHVAGTSEEYGFVKPDEIPIKETNFLKPMSPYGVSKVAADLLAQQYNYSYGLHTIVTRAFNHEGPRRGRQYVISNFIIQALQSDIINTGNTETIRDFTDVRDMVKAYWLAIRDCEAGQVYNICSEKGVKINDLIPMIGSILKKELKVIRDNSLFRPSDVPILIGDCTKFKKETGWQPAIPLETTIRDMVEYWKGELGK